MDRRRFILRPDCWAYCMLAHPYRVAFAHPLHAAFRVDDLVDVGPVADGLRVIRAEALVLLLMGEAFETLHRVADPSLLFGHALAAGHVAAVAVRVAQEPLVEAEPLAGQQHASVAAAGGLDTHVADLGTAGDVQ